MACIYCLDFNNELWNVSHLQKSVERHNTCFAFATQISEIGWTDVVWSLLLLNNKIMVIQYQIHSIPSLSFFSRFAFCSYPCCLLFLTNVWIHKQFIILSYGLKTCINVDTCNSRFSFIIKFWNVSMLVHIHLVHPF